MCIYFCGDSSVEKQSRLKKGCLKGVVAKHQINAGDFVQCEQMVKDVMHLGTVDAL
jgi:hypothetical protein